MTATSKVMWLNSNIVGSFHSASDVPLHTMMTADHNIKQQQTLVWHWANAGSLIEIYYGKLDVVNF